MMFGETLKAIRRKKNKTQREIADEIGMDYSYFSRLENERFSSKPTRDTIDKIADALRCTEEERRELIAAAGRIDEKVEVVARIATGERPELGELFLAAVQLPPERIEEIVKELRAEVEAVTANG
jgi:HTH-type transcriptional regulator, competence development regulator